MSLAIGPTMSEVVSTLATAGYRIQSSPFTISGIPFAFDALLTGPENSLELVVVVDSNKQDEQRIQDQLSGLALALDGIGSCRSLTLVVIGKPLTQSARKTLEQFARVLGGKPSSDSGWLPSVEDMLAVLIPLDLKFHNAALAEPMQRLYSSMTGTPKRDYEHLIEGSKSGAIGVQNALRGEIEKIVGSVLR